MGPNMKFFPILSLALSLAGFSPAFASNPSKNLKPSKNAQCETSLSSLFSISKDGLSGSGLTKEGLKNLLAQRAKLKQAYEVTASEVLGAENIIRGLMLAPIAGYNALLLGGPGSSKTQIIRRLFPDIWMAQFSEDSKKMGVLGGQPLDQAEKGLEAINLEQSIVRSLIANIDEVDKGPPGLLTALLSLLNPGERYITVGGKIVQADTRSVLITSNLNSGALLKKFLQESMLGTGKAFLDRLQMKMMVVNWLPDHLRLEMLKRSEERDRLKALASIGSREAQLALQKQEIPTDIDWEFLGRVSGVMFDLPPATMAALNDLVGQFRQRMTSELSLSKEQNGYEEMAPDKPTAYLSNRSANETRPIIRASALLDLLLSDLSDEQISSALSGEPIPLPPTSIWRTHWMLTGVGPGLTRLNSQSLELDLNLVNQLDGRFVSMDGSYLASVATDLDEAKDLSFFQKEQTLWLQAVTEVLETEKTVRKKVAAALPEDSKKIDFTKVNFEAVVARGSK